MGVAPYYQHETGGGNQFTASATAMHSDHVGSMGPHPQFKN